MNLNDINQTAEISFFDILDANHAELSALAAEIGIDWQALRPLIHPHQTSYKSNSIALERQYRGKVAAFLTCENNVPVITFKTFKHGGITRTFNGFAYIKATRQQSPRTTPAPAHFSLLRCSCGKAVSKNSPTQCDDCLTYQNRLTAFNATTHEFSTLPKAETSPYFEIKALALPANLDIRRGTDFVIIALRDIEGRITGYQKIFDDGKKRFTFYPRKDGNTLKQGSFFVIGNLLNAKKLWFVEGLATGLSVSAATSETVVVCLDAGNLHPVLKAFKNSDYRLLIAADNDYSATGNTGIYSALKAAQYTKARIFAPVIINDTGDFIKCDFDDLRQAQGLAAVQHQLRTSKGDNEIELTPENLVKYCPQPQLKKLAIALCHEYQNRIFSRSTLRKHANRLQKLFDSRGFPFNIRRFMLSLIKGGLYAKIKAQNTITHHERIEEIDITGLDNHAIAAKIRELNGIVIDNRPMGAGKTQLMRLLRQGGEKITHTDVKAHYFANGGTAEAWQTINNNPQRFDQQLRNTPQTQAPESVMYIAHRVSLIDSAANALNLDHYETCRHFAPSHLAVCANSIIKFEARAYDLVCCDEFRQSNEHVYIGKTDKRLAVSHRLAELINQAKLALLADADFNDMSLNWLFEHCGNRKIYRLIDRNPINHAKNLIFSPVERGSIDKLIAQAVAQYQQGHRVWLSFDSIDQAKKAAANFGNEGVLLIHKENKAEPAQAAFLANPNAESAKYRAIIHSPVISSGVSITHEFDFVGAGFVGVLPPNEMLQTIARVRTAQAIHIACTHGQNERDPAELNALLLGELFKNNRFIEKNEIDPFVIRQLKLYNDSQNALADYWRGFLILAQLRGYHVTEVERADATLAVKTKDIKKFTVSDILNAEPISDFEAARLDVKTALTQTESNELARFKTVEMAGTTELTEDDVEFYWYENGADKLANYELLQAADSELKAVDLTNAETKQRLSSKTSKAALFKGVVAQLEGEQITTDTIAFALAYLQTHAAEIAANGLGNYTQPSHSARKLNGFLEKFGFKLIETGREATGRRKRLYQLCLNPLIAEYIARRPKVDFEIYTTKTLLDVTKQQLIEEAFVKDDDAREVELSI